KVIALRDLARHLDPDAAPRDPLAVIAERRARLSLVDLAVEHAARRISCVGGEWGVQGGQLRQTSTRGGAFAFFRKQVYADVVLSFRFRVGGTGDGVRAAGALVRSRDSESFYGVHFDTCNGQVVLYASPWHGRPDWTVLARKAIAL